MTQEPNLIIVTLPPRVDKNAVADYLNTAWMYSNSEIKEGAVLSVIAQFIPSDLQQEKAAEELCLKDIRAL